MNEPLCTRCGHRESAHIASGPNETVWCRLCYGGVDHAKRNHEFEPAPEH